jgi:hypothetical protein
MEFPITLLDLAGAVALLLWGIHMVQTGIQRAFGAKLRSFLGSALRNRFKSLSGRDGRHCHPTEQHRHPIKRQTRPMMGFKSFRSAAVTLVGIELMHMIRKGQLRTSGQLPGQHREL